MRSQGPTERPDLRRYQEGVKQVRPPQPWTSDMVPPTFLQAAMKSVLQLANFA